ncbi:MAG: hypothetical protein AAB733_02250 [Patescibacteria group bacterium]
MHELCGGVWIEGAQNIRPSAYHTMSNVWIVEGWEGGLILLLKEDGVTMFDPAEGDLMDVRPDNRCASGRVTVLSHPNPRALCVEWTMPEDQERTPLNDLPARVWLRLLEMLEAHPPTRTRIIARRVQ